MRKHCMSINNFNTNKWGNVQYNVTLTHDRVTTAAMKKTLHILSVSL
jgi:hypothetical protein